MKTLNSKIKKIISVTAFLLTSSVISSAAVASTNSPGIDSKQQNQKQRIHNGVNSGQLTGQETWRLANQQGKIYHKEQRLKADGNFTRRERAVIHRDLLKSSKSIYGQKHDRQIQGQKRLSQKNAGINKRQIHQGKRIRQGVGSGELTGREVARLGHQQVRIQKQKRHFKADGSFTKRERLRVHKSQNRASKNIYRKKHNNRRK